MENRSSFNSFLNKVTLIEKSFGRHVCQICIGYSTDKDKEFNDHLEECHNDNFKINCIYCAINIDSGKYVEHVNYHFEENRLSKSICKECECLIDISDMISIMEHIEMCHGSNLICPICQQEFQDFALLDAHLGESVRVVYHCGFKGCRVKTNIRGEMKDHLLISGHKKELVVTENIATCLYDSVDVDYSRPLHFQVPEGLLLSKVARNKTSLKIPTKRSARQLSRVICASDSLESLQEKLKKENKVYDKDFEVESTFEYTYSESEFRYVFAHKSATFLSVLKSKLDKFNGMSVGQAIIDEVSYHVCMDCFYKTKYKLSDIRKHILSIHCGISNDLFSDCSRVISKKNDDVAEQDREVRVERRIGARHSANCTADPLQGSEEFTLARRKKVPKVYARDFEVDSAFGLTLYEEELREYLVDKPPSYVDDLMLKLAVVNEVEVSHTVVDNVSFLVCLYCNYKTKYTFRDLKKHIVATHCELGFDLATVCSKFVEVKNDTEQGNEAMERLLCKRRQTNTSEFSVTAPIISPNLKRRRSFRTYEKDVEVNFISNFIYSEEEFRKYFERKSPKFMEDLKLKLDIFQSISVGQANVGDQKYHVCMECNYKCKYLIRDMKKHILARHCDVDHALHNDCCKITTIKNDFEQKDLLEEDGESMVLRAKTTDTEVEELFKLVPRDDLITEFLIDKDPDTISQLKKKFKNMTKYSIGSKVVDGFQYFICRNCNYMCKYLVRDMKKHILAKHCNVDQSLLSDYCRITSIKSDTELKDLLEEVVESRPMRAVRAKTIDDAILEEDEFKLVPMDDLITEFLIDKDPDTISQLKKKFKTMTKYSIGSKVVDGFKYFICMECNYTCKYLVRDMKKHILAKHCDVDQNLLSDCCRITSIKSDTELKDLVEEDTGVTNEEFSMVHPYADVVPAKRRKIRRTYDRNFDIESTFNFTYSEADLRKCFEDKSRAFVEKMKLGLDKFERLKVGQAYIGDVKYHVCMKCNYKTSYFMRNMKKHLLAVHCDISLEWFSECCKVISIMDENIDPAEQEDVENRLTRVVRSRTFDTISEVEELFDLFTRDDRLTEYLADKDPDVVFHIQEKIKTMMEYTIGRKAIEGLKYFICMECFYKSCHNLRDVKNHILTIHCFLDREYLVDVAKIVNVLPKSLSERDGEKEGVKKEKIETEEEEKKKTKRGRDSSKKRLMLDTSAELIIVIESLPMETLEKKPRLYERDFDILLSYNLSCDAAAFVESFPSKSLSFISHLKEKLEIIKDMPVGEARIDDVKYHVCLACNYKSKHSLIDIKRHILKMHCDVDWSLAPKCIKHISRADEADKLHEPRVLQNIENTEDNIVGGPSQKRDHTIHTAVPDKHLAAEDEDTALPVLPTVDI